MKAMQLLLLLGVAVVLAPVHVEAKARAYNGSNTKIVLIYRAGGCAGVEYPLIASCGKRSDYDAYVCAKKILRPGEKTSYNFKWGTSSRDVVAFWCDANNVLRYAVGNTGNTGNKSRCAATGTAVGSVAFKCGYTRSAYPPTGQ